MPRTERTFSIGRGPLPEDLIVHVLMLLLADDIAVFTESSDDLDHFIQMMNEVCTRWGFTISIDKTKILVITGGDRPAKPSIRINGQELEVVQAGKYLGSWYSENGSLNKELNVRVGASNGAARKLRNILHSRNVQISKKIKVYNGLVLPILLYGAESWPLSAAQTAKLESIHQRHLRRILGVTWRDFVSHADVHARLGTIPIAEHCRRQRLLWLGHVARMPDSRLPKQLLFGHFSGPRRRGRIHNLRHVYEMDVQSRQGGTSNGLNWYEIAQDRGSWDMFARGEVIVQQPAEVGAPSAGAADAIEPQPFRRSHRISRRMGQTSAVPLVGPLLTPSGQPRLIREISLEYSGRPRGRPRGSGRGTQYIPTGRNRGRPRGSKNRPHGFSVDL